MSTSEFVSYYGSPPILLPVSVRKFWRGFYLPIDALPDEYDPETIDPDLVLPEGAYVIWDEFDFDNPKTDYDRACSNRSDRSTVHTVPVGPGLGLVFSTELKRHYWWQEKIMLLDGGGLPDIDKLATLNWTDELRWSSDETDFILMNSCDHGASPAEKSTFDVFLPRSEYIIQRAETVSSDGDQEYCLIIHRFLVAH